MAALSAFYKIPRCGKCLLWQITNDYPLMWSGNHKQESFMKKITMLMLALVVLFGFALIACDTNGDGGNNGGNNGGVSRTLVAAYFCSNNLNHMYKYSINGGFAFTLYSDLTGEFPSTYYEEIGDTVTVSGSGFSFDGIYTKCVGIPPNCTNH